MVGFLTTKTGTEKQNHRHVIQFVTLDPRVFFGVGKKENFENFGAHRVTIRSSGHEEKLPGQFKNGFSILDFPPKLTNKSYLEIF